METSEDQSVFDDVLLEIGDSGKFQKRFNFIFTFLYVIITTMTTLNSLVSVAIPDHWCFVPGRKLTNYSLEEWKNLTIPRNNHGEFSKCEMLNVTNVDHNFRDPNNSAIGCDHGWEYDKTYYRSTIASQENWVCAQELNLPNFLVFGKIGELIGTLLFAQIGDTCGRRPVFYGSALIVLIGRVGFLFADGMSHFFFLLNLLGSLTGVSLVQSTIVISLEISNPEDRTYISLVQNIAWTIGLAFGPFILWAVGDWKIYTLITTLPIIPFLFLRKYMIESPRWLVSRGKVEKSIKTLKKIAKTNKKEVTDKTLAPLRIKSEVKKPETSYGIFSLFSNKTLVKITVITNYLWATYFFFYVSMMLNVNNLEGNPYMNYFWQGIAEIPGTFLAKYLADNIGRRFTYVIAYILIGIVSFFLAYISSTSGHALTILVGVILLRAASPLVFCGLQIHTLELYPTPLRQNGIAVGYFTGVAFSALVPYVLYLGTTINPSLPYVITGGLTIVAGIFGVFLPETLHQKLPETVEEIRHFGKDQKMWSIPKKI